MSKSTKILLCLAVAAFVAGCAKKVEEVTVVDTVTTEPTETGKYK